MYQCFNLEQVRILSLLFFQQMTQIDTDLKSKAQAYNNLKGNLQAMERKQT